MKLRRMLAISLAISIAALVAVLLLVAEEETYSALLKIKPHYLLIAIGIHIFTWVIWGMRIRILSRSVGDAIPLKSTTNIVISSLLPAAITPSHVGGEALRIYLLRKNGVSYGDATAITMGERVLDAVAIFTALPIGLFIFWGVIAGNIVASYILGSSIIFFFILIAIFLYIIIRAKNVEQFIKFFIRSEKWSQKIGEEALKFRSTLLKYFTQAKWITFLGFVCTVAFWILEFIVPSFILLSLGCDPFWAYSIAAQTILVIFILVPITPGGSGMMELITTLLYGAIGVGVILAVFVVIWRFVTYHINIIFGGIFCIKILKEISEI